MINQKEEEKETQFLGSLHQGKRVLSVSYLKNKVSDD
jgi:hypothetical protein